MRTPLVQRHSGTHKVSGKPEHNDLGYLLLLPGSKNRRFSQLAVCLAREAPVLFPHLLPNKWEPLGFWLVHQEDLAAAHHLERAAVEVGLSGQ